MRVCERKEKDRDGTERLRKLTNKMKVAKEKQGKECRFQNDLIAYQNLLRHCNNLAVEKSLITQQQETKGYR